MADKLSHPSSYDQDEILALQRKFGNQATIQILRGERPTFALPGFETMMPTEAHASAIAQPGASESALVQRTPIAVKKEMSAGEIARKKKKMHLDFVRMKRKKEHIGSIILKKMGLKPPGGDDYGHWWTEIGDLDAGQTWKPKESYGWWPSKKVDLGKTFKGVPGQLNKGQGKKDPHHGHPADIEFHPTLMVDDNDSYDTIRQHVTAGIIRFVRGFSGSWNWRLGWGKNCHSFQKRMKKAVGLHYQKSKRWLLDPKVQAKEQALEQKRKDDDAAAAAAYAVAHPEPKLYFISKSYLDFYRETDDNKLEKIGMLRNNTHIGVTGVEKDFQYGTYSQIKMDGKWYWMEKPFLDAELENVDTSPTPLNG